MPKRDCFIHRPWRRCTKPSCDLMVPPWVRDRTTCCDLCEAHEEDAGLARVGHRWSCQDCQTEAETHVKHLTPDGFALPHYDRRDEENVVKLCRRASRIHFDMILNPNSIVYERMEPETREFYAEREGFWHYAWQRLGALALMILVFALPYGYANVMMDEDDFCKKGIDSEDLGKDVVTDSLSGIAGNHGVGGDAADKAIDLAGGKIAKWVESGTEESRCQFYKDFHQKDALLKTGLRWAFYPVEATIALGIVTLFLRYYASAAMECSCICLTIKRLIWKPLLILWYYQVDPALPKLKYGNHVELVPFLYSPPSVFVCTMHTVIFGYMVGACCYYRLPIMGVTLGFGLLKVFNEAAGQIFRTSDEVINRTQESLNNWYPKYCFSKKSKNPLEGETVIQKLQHAADEQLTVVSLTHADLIQLQELNIKTPARDLESQPLVNNEVLGSFDDRAEEEGTLDDVGVFTKVFLEDLNCSVNLIWAQVDRSDKLLQKFKFLMKGNWQYGDE